ncbi:CMGC/SRPK protein kinase [[Emmonsia] crescens]|uniref:non-specific serine/threonine protein kinase n=1 Tax=[Emmonsia] crescens TaxID=73230 RepID=A0A2B7Z8T9_9EURO|nr:CMGC/SRPK protein kinase [Emmonsia crescens]
MKLLRLCMRGIAKRNPQSPHHMWVASTCVLSPLRRPPTVSQPQKMLVRSLSSLPGVPIPLAPRSFPTSGFEVIDHSELMEEEKLPGYMSELYYPAYIGQVFNSRYRIVGKLGYGVTSTVWLARDLVEPDNPGYVALKIYVTGYTRGNEAAIYERINSVAAKSNHIGHELIRKFLSSFELEGPHGKHTCIVQQALGITMDHLMPYLENKVLPLDLVKQFFRQLLLGLDFLHSQAGIIHTDLQLKNLLLPVSNPLFYKEFEDGEFNDPVPRKIYKDRTVYSSRYMTQDPQALPFICDFGDARFDDQEHDELIMPEPYRAPEILLQMKWNNKVDIWSFAMVAWQLVAPRSLFSGLGTETNKYHDAHLLAEQHAVMGPAPPELARRTKIYSVANGKTSCLCQTSITLEQLAEGIQGDEEQKAGFLRFIRRILRWLPEERPTAKDLFFDPWLIDGLGITEEQVEDFREMWLEVDGEGEGEGVSVGGLAKVPYSDNQAIAVAAHS